MSIVDHPLILGENFSLEPFPQQFPDDKSSTVLIVGGGVTGLINAWVLLDRGYHVTVVSKEWASFTEQQRLTSQIAGALWEFPPAVCGQHTDILSLKKSKHWCMVAYDIWAAIASNPSLAALAGVQMRASNFFFPCAIEELPAQHHKMEEIAACGVHGFSRSIESIHKHGIDPRYGAVDAYEHLAPVIDTDRCMEWLMLLVQSKGAKFHTETITSDLFSQEQELLDRFSADVILNCTGLSALSLAGDKTCYPLRGALIRVINDGKDFPKVESSLAITADAAQDNEIVFIVPRNDNILLIGGVAQPGRWDLDLTLDSPEIKRMRTRAEAFLPSLKHARVDPEYPIAQGLRPAREKNIRVERELRTRTMDLHGEPTEEPSRIIHNYGHGGSGWSLSFGCAADVANLVEDVLHNLPASKMKLQEKVVVENVRMPAPLDPRLMSGPIRARL
ncbi:MAG: hypothetical protein LQ337_006017 [Flavoplaca oasis]|nr:MAG: hypothetical protein LQ337_006017 [Flavoplaca oasis]